MPGDNFIRTLLLACEEEKQGDSLQSLSEKVMGQFLAMGSETEDNLNSYYLIEYGMVDEQLLGFQPTSGLKVKNKNILVSQVLNVLEDLELPPEVKEAFPDLTDKEWQAITRVTTMVMLALECPSQ